MRAYPRDQLQEHFSSPTRVKLEKLTDLRYGENPHQAAAIYRTALTGGVAQAELLSGKEMSFNNYVDADAAWQLVCDFDEIVCAVIKHTNPAGIALGPSAVDAYRRALATDPVSAFGGIVAFNCEVDAAAARAVAAFMKDLVLTPTVGLKAQLEDARAIEQRLNDDLSCRSPAHRRARVRLSLSPRIGSRR